MDYIARLARLEKSVLGAYATYSGGDRREDERTGAKHGRSSIPSSEEERHPYREELVTRANRDLAAFNAALDDVESELAADEERLALERDDFYIHRRDEVRDEYDSSIASAERLLGPNSALHSGARKLSNDAQLRFSRLESELGRPVRVRLRWTFPVIMLAVALLEVPVNRFAFEYFFGESAVLSLALAVGLGFALAFVAHIVGSCLKFSTAFKRLKERIGYYVQAGLCLIIIGPLFYFLALIREKYVQFMEQTSVGFGEMLRQEGALEAASKLLDTEMTTAGWTLLLLNIVLFGIGVAASFIRHDPHPDYEGVARKSEKLQKKYEEIRIRYEAKIDELTKERDEKLALLARQHERISNALGEIDKAREIIANYRERAGQQAVLYVRQRVQVYELANRQGRAGGAIPRVFGKADEEDFGFALEKGAPGIAVLDGGRAAG